MQCIKTGFVLYISSLDKFARMDLFYDGMDLYSNNNDLFAGKPNNIDVECTSISEYGRYNLINNPIVNESLIKYVDDFKYKGHYEELFLSKFKKDA